jgi:hypothetical protein
MPWMTAGVWLPAEQRHSHRIVVRRRGRLRAAAPAALPGKAGHRARRPPTRLTAVSSAQVCLNPHVMLCDHALPCCATQCAA